MRSLFFLSIHALPHLFKLHANSVPLFVSGAHALEKVRLLSYRDTHIFVVCFSVVKPESFENVSKVWMKELNGHGPPRATIILVGLQGDLRSDEDVNKELHASGLESPTIDQVSNCSLFYSCIGETFSSAT